MIRVAAVKGLLVAGKEPCKIALRPVLHEYGRILAHVIGIHQKADELIVVIILTALCDLVGGKVGGISRKQLKRKGYYLKCGSLFPLPLSIANTFFIAKPPEIVKISIYSI